jgi:hypothetical protein
MPTPGPFDFKALRAARRAAPRALYLAPSPIVEAPATLPFSIPFPEYSSPLDFASAADIALWVLESQALDEEQGLDEIDAYHAQLTAEAEAAGDLPKILKERWIEKPRNCHYCAQCRGDIDYGERHLSQLVSTPEGVRSDRICEHCADGNARRSGGCSNAERNGTQLYREAGGASLDRNRATGGQAARTRRA